MNDFINQLAKPGADFAAIAKANSEAADAAKGGDMGWIAHDQLSRKLEDAIFALPVGKVSDMITDDTTLYVFKVTEEQTRLPDKDQMDTLTRAPSPTGMPPSRRRRPSSWTQSSASTSPRSTGA